MIAFVITMKIDTKINFSNFLMSQIITSDNKKTASKKKFGQSMYKTFLIRKKKHDKITKRNDKISLNK